MPDTTTVVGDVVVTTIAPALSHLLVMSASNGVVTALLTPALAQYATTLDTPLAYRTYTAPAVVVSPSQMPTVPVRSTAPGNDVDAHGTDSADIAANATPAYRTPRNVTDPAAIVTAASPDVEATRTDTGFVMS
jgi:hypothetical protein